MRRTGQSGRKAATLLGLLALAVAIGGCSSVKNMFGSSSDDKPAAPGTEMPGTTAGGTPSPTEIDCPSVDIRTGAGTLLIAGKPGVTNTSALDLRYQGTIARTARECTPTAGIMNMKIGIEGRIISGPAGGPGKVDVPLRIAVVHEGPAPKTVLSKLIRILVEIGPGTDHVNFTHIDQEIAFPLPKPIDEISSYVVYVGFDPSAMTPQKKPKPAPKRKR